MASLILPSCSQFHPSPLASYCSPLLLRSNLTLAHTWHRYTDAGRMWGSWLLRSFVLSTQAHPAPSTLSAAPPLFSVRLLLFPPSLQQSGHTHNFVGVLLASHCVSHPGSWVFYYCFFLSLSRHILPPGIPTHYILIPICILILLNERGAKNHALGLLCLATFHSPNWRLQSPSKLARNFPL